MMHAYSKEFLGSLAKDAREKAEEMNHLVPMLHIGEEFRYFVSAYWKYIGRAEILEILATHADGEGE